jgi:hypothetical protein
VPGNNKLVSFDSLQLFQHGIWQEKLTTLFLPAP